MPQLHDDDTDPKSRLEGFIRSGADGNFELLVNEQVVSSSKHEDYWEYHQRRGDLAKAIVQLGITKFVHALCKRFDCSTKAFHSCQTCTVREAQPSQKAFINHAFVNPGTSFLAILGFYDKPKDDPQPEVKRKRGRPKKQTAMVTEIAPGVRQNHLSDDEPVTVRFFNKAEISKMKTEYNRMVDSGDSMKESLIELTKKYKIPYKRAYELVMS